MSPAEYPWYEEVAANVPVLQGDIIETCPVLIFDPVPRLPAGQIDAAAVVAALDGAAGVQFVRAIVMTQACDLEQGHVRNVILCPVYHLNAEYRPRWEAYQRAHDQNPTEKAWRGFTAEVKDGKKWNLAMLADRPGPDGGLIAPHLIVDFHEVFSVPVDFLNAVVTARNAARLRLCPPYREHLSQAFARFFMRVGLPLNIDL